MGNIKNLIKSIIDDVYKKRQSMLFDIKMSNLPKLNLITISVRLKNTDFITNFFMEKYKFRSK